MSRALWVVAAVWLGCISPVNAGAACSKDAWVASWGTAQPITRQPAPPPARPASAGTPPSPFVPYPETIGDKTVRMIARVSVGGPQLRLEFSNVLGSENVTFDAVHVALNQAGDAIVAASDRVVTFGGRSSVTLFPGARAVSDPVSLQVPALARVAVSIHLSKSTRVDTVHALGLNPAYLAEGNQVAATDFVAPETARSYFWLSGVSVAPSACRGGSIVAFGDSITDGYATTPGKHSNWPDLLAARLQSEPATNGWGVVNSGISGNRILKAGAGDSAVARFDRDVLAHSSVKWLIVLEGINDINMSIIPGVPPAESVTPDQIIEGLEQLVGRAHLHGIKVAGATIMPTKGWNFYGERGEAMRQEVNSWIRTSGRFDAIIDFDRATQDPGDPLRLRPEYDSGDHVHPSDAGNKAMADAIDLALFRQERK